MGEASSTTNLAAASLKLTLAVSDFANSISGSPADISAKFLAVQDSFYDVAQYIPGPTNTSLDFETFFSSVSNSFISAQKNLDGLSLDYLNKLRDPSQSHVIPSVFKIPKVSADIKCAFTTKDGTNLQLIFYSQSSEATSLHQQSVQFDIVAAPPPVLPPGTLSSPPGPTTSPPPGPVSPPRPMMMANAAADPAPLKMVAQSDTRQELRNILQQQQASGANKGFAADFPVILENFDRLLIFERATDAYFLAFADYKKSGNDTSHLGIWALDVSGRSPSMEAIYRYTLQPKSGEDPSTLQQFISDLGKKQQAAAG